MYKYNCRKCPIRNRCITESKNADSIRIMIRRAFEARTDTLATWGRLQKDCLLVKAETEKKIGTSPLTERLQIARDAKSTDAEEDTQETEVTKKPVLRRLKPLGGNSNTTTTQQKAKTDQYARFPEYLQPVSTPQEKPNRPLKRLSGGSADTGPERYWLTINTSRRHIALPEEGSLILGRFDPNVGIPPDIDLAYEDMGAHLISRRHATLVGRNGKHTIEDLGSTVGIYLNGSKLGYGPSHILEPDDVIKLGNVGLQYQKIPPEILKQARTKQVKHVLHITPTGRKLTLAPSKTAVIGRTDPRINFVPDIDLSHDGDVARLVSRRHALIQWRYGQPYLEDLGSGFGTRLRGELLPLGQSTPLSPGDHIWLAGCVLAYDIET